MSTQSSPRSQASSGRQAQPSLPGEQAPVVELDEPVVPVEVDVLVLSVVLDPPLVLMVPGVVKPPELLSASLSDSIVSPEQPTSARPASKPKILEDMLLR